MAWIIKDSEVVETVLEDGAVLLNLKTRFYYSLNEVGYRIWQLLDVAESSEDLSQKIMSEYQAEDKQVKENVSDFIKELEREKLVTPHEDGMNRQTQQEAQEHDSNASQSSEKKPFSKPELIKHDEPLHEVVQNPFDPQLPLAE